MREKIFPQTVYAIDGEPAYNGPPQIRVMDVTPHIPVCVRETQVAVYELKEVKTLKIKRELV